MLYMFDTPAPLFRRPYIYGLGLPTFIFLNLSEYYIEQLQN